MGFLPRILPRSAEERRAELERQLIRNEAQIGGRLFGAIPTGHRREFFCLDEHTWVWHEQWLQNGLPKAVNTYYTVRPDTILKSQDGNSHYKELSLTEAKNFYKAVNLYGERVNEQYSRQLQAA